MCTRSGRCGVSWTRTARCGGRPRYRRPPRPDRARPGAWQGGRTAGGPGGGNAHLPGARRPDGDRDEAPVVQCPPAPYHCRLAQEDPSARCVLDREGAAVRDVSASGVCAERRDSRSAGAAQPAAGPARRLPELALPGARVSARGGLSGAGRLPPCGRRSRARVDARREFSPTGSRSVGGRRRRCGRSSSGWTRRWRAGSPRSTLSSGS